MVRIAGGDGIRGLACLIVLVVHSFQFNYQKLAPYSAGCGKIGVWLFFVLSSFLLTYQLDTNGFSWRSSLNYMMGRVFRILPLFILGAFVYYLFGYIGDLSTLKEIILFKKGYAHLWTIPVEFKFYFILPFMALFFLQIRKSAGITGVLLVTVISLFICTYFWPPNMLPGNSIDTMWYIPSFMLGCVGAVVFRFITPHLTHKRASIIGIIIVFFILLKTPPIRFLLWGTPPQDVNLMFDFISLSFSWIIFVMTQIDGKGLFGKYLTNGLLPNIGKVSYSVYLFHWFVYIEILNYIHAGFMTMCISILGAFIPGFISYRYLELPLVKVRQKSYERLVSWLADCLLRKTSKA